MVEGLGLESGDQFEAREVLRQIPNDLRLDRSQVQEAGDSKNEKEGLRFAHAREQCSDFGPIFQWN